MIKRRAQWLSNSNSAMPNKSLSEEPPIQEAIPYYRIDLSLPPSDRYTQLATDLAPRMRYVTSLFDDILAAALPWAWSRVVVKWLATFVLWRVYCPEETQELRSISKASGVDLYFLVAMNVVLDSLMGCTSGGALTKPNQQVEKARMYGDRLAPRMMHFRTLDWSMDKLRDILVVLEFVDRKSKTPERVIATTITYAGFVGLLTGVRRNLSISLNLRSAHNGSTFTLRLHQFLVLLGFRPSIASILRSNFLSREGVPQPLDELTATLTKCRSSPCYLILSSGTKTTVIEKDLLGGQSRTSMNFIVHTNHDVQITTTPKTMSQETHEILGMQTVLEESVDRLDCVQRKWNSLVKRQEKKRKEDGQLKYDGSVTFVRERILQHWVEAYPVKNECTHFACIMDPTTGTIRWLERGELESDSE